MIPKKTHKKLGMIICCYKKLFPIAVKSAHRRICLNLFEEKEKKTSVSVNEWMNEWKFIYI